MTNELNVRPMLEDAAADQDVRALLRVGQIDGPSQADLERLAKRLAPAVGLAALTIPDQALASTLAPANPAALPKVAAASKGLFAKLTISGITKIVATVSAVGAATFLMWPSSPVPHAKVTAAPAKIEQEQPKSVVAQDLAPEVAPEEPAVAAPEPKQVAPKPRARVQPKAAMEAPSAEPESELALMRRAQDLRANPSEALRVLSEHARLYPDGMLAQEREVLAIEALLSEGRRAEAETRATRMEKLYPGSAHLRRVRVLLGAPPSE